MDRKRIIPKQEVFKTSLKRRLSGALDGHISEPGLDELVSLINTMVFEVELTFKEGELRHAFIVPMGLKAIAEGEIPTDFR